MSSREPYAAGRDRLGFYQKLLGLGYSPERANDISLKISRDIYSYRLGRIWDASGRVEIAELGSIAAEDGVGDRTSTKLRRTCSLVEVR